MSFYCRYWYFGISENSWRLLGSFFETPRSHVRLQVCLYRLQIVFFSGEISEEQETGEIWSSFTQLHVILNLFDVLSVEHKIHFFFFFLYIYDISSSKYPLVFHRRKKVIKVWNNMKRSKWWLNFLFFFCPILYVLNKTVFQWDPEIMPQTRLSEREKRKSPTPFIHAGKQITSYFWFCQSAWSKTSFW